MQRFRELKILLNTFAGRTQATGMKTPFVQTHAVHNRFDFIRL